MDKTILNVLLLITALLLFVALPMSAQTIENIILNVQWSPDGQFVSYLASDRIHVMDKYGNNNHLLAPPSGFGGWTADSSSVFIVENNPSEGTLSWWMYPINGADAIQFLPQLHSISTLAYSHDGEQIAISAQESLSDPYKVWVGNADGSELRPLAEYQIYELGWSSDDTEIVFETLEDDDGQNRQIVEVSIDVSGNNDPQMRPLVDGVISIGDTIDVHYATDISYPPATYYIDSIQDSQQIVFTVNQWVADFAYSEQSQSIVYTAYCSVSDLSESFLQGEWSATEQEIVETTLHQIDVVTNEQTMLIPCGNGSQNAISFSPDGQEILFVWINHQQWDIYRVIADEDTFVNLTEE